MYFEDIKQLLGKNDQTSGINRHLYLISSPIERSCTLTPVDSNLKLYQCHWVSKKYQFIFKTLQQASGCHLCMVSQLIINPFEATLTPVDSNLKLNNTGCSN